MISHGSVLYELNVVIPDFSREFLVLLECFSCFSQMLNFRIDDFVASLTGLAYDFLKFA